MMTDHIEFYANIEKEIRHRAKMRRIGRVVGTLLNLSAYAVASYCALGYFFG